MPIVVESPDPQLAAVGAQLTIEEAPQLLEMFT
jgi:hypothetical protein